jgi:hypothetical protein
MKKIMLFATIVAMSMAVAMPAQAQTRKEKKAAKHDQWEMRQQFIKDSTERANKAKLDAMDNAQKMAEEKAAREEADRRAKEAEEKARQKKAERDAALQEKEFNEPCMEFESTATLIRARGIGEDLEQQMSVEIARSAAIEELGSQISTKVQALMMNYKKSLTQNRKRESLRRVEGLTMTEVDQATGYRVACRKTTTFEENGERVFKTYIVIELGEDQLLKPIYDSIQKDEELKVDADYQAFKQEFDEHFKNKSQEALEQTIKEAQE